MTLAALGQRIGLAIEGGDVAVTGFAIDHRKIAPGTVFGAFRGARFNAEDFIPAARLVTNGHLFVFWAGNADPRALTRYADLQVTATARGKEDLKVELERFYTDLGLSLSGMQILRISGR